MQRKKNGSIYCCIAILVFVWQHMCDLLVLNKAIYRAIQPKMAKQTL